MHIEFSVGSIKWSLDSASALQLHCLRPFDSSERPVNDLGSWVEFEAVSFSLDLLRRLCA